MPVLNRFRLSLSLIALGAALGLASGCAAPGPAGLRSEPSPASGEAAPPRAPRVDKSRLARAPELASTVWINSPPLAAMDLRGRVVVVDFWTFACYNCKNTLPYFKAWDQTYRERGLVIIGVHT